MSISTSTVYAVMLTLSAQGGTVFFSVINDQTFGGNEINRVESDGSGFEHVYENLGMPLGLTYDKGRGQLYWTDGYDTLHGSNRPTIWSSAVDGSGSMAVAILPNYPGPTVPIIGDVTYDSLSDRIYWGDLDAYLGGVQVQTRAYVGQVNADGTGLGPAFTYQWGPGVLLGSDNMVAAGMGNFYHTGSLGRIFANGNVAAPLISNGAGTTFHAMELYEAGAGSKLFWIENQTLFSAFTDGSGVTALLGGINNGTDLDFDYDEDKVYWSDDRRSLDGTSQIRRANLDGSDEEVVYTINGGVNRIEGIAIVPEPSASLFALLGGLLISARRRRN